VPLIELKESSLVEGTDYAIRMAIDAKPAFVWWVPYICKTTAGISCIMHLSDHGEFQ